MEEPPPDKANLYEAAPSSKDQKHPALSEKGPPRDVDGSVEQGCDNASKDVSTVNKAVWSHRAESPKNNKETSEDNNSFALFSNSFDTLSETSARRDAATSPFSTPVGREAVADNRTPRNLKHDSESDYSLGDLSPIKVVYHNDTNNNSGTAIMAGAIIDDHKDGSVEANFGSPGFHHDYDHPAAWGDETDQYSHQGRLSTSNPFFVIRTAAAALGNCLYVLPCLRGKDVCQVHVSEYSHIRHYQRHEGATTMIEEDLKIAFRRVEAAICAFGGNVNPKRKHVASSIFRFKGSSSARQLYERRLPSRYFLSGSRISWEVEENPPVFIDNDEGDLPTPPPKKKSRHDGTRDSDSFASPSYGSGSASKMKYRCKKCGQLKQNHTCPYRHFLQRSIGVMVYPAVNSFTAAEPGTIAPPLTKMNNFVSYDSDGGSPMHRGFTGTEVGSSSILHPSAVTPEALRTAVASLQSPQSSLSVQSDDATPPTAHTAHMRGRLGDSPAIAQQSDSQLGMAIEIETKRSPFVASVSLRQEHYRAVSTVDESSAAFQYPVVPLTFAERKRLSDTLFHLCQEVPTMLSECASVLRAAREKKDWDQAVAELLTQVVIGLHCAEGDTRLDGLQQYLLAVGISC